MAGPWENFQTSSSAAPGDGPWKNFAEQKPWEAFHDRPAVQPFHGAQLHDRAPLPRSKTNEELWANVVPAQLKPADPLEMAASNPNLPVGARALAAVPDVLVKQFMGGVIDPFHKAAQQVREGQPVSPENIGGPAMGMLAGAPEGAKGVPKPVEAPKPRIEPPPLDATRARVAGTEAVGKVADRVSRGPLKVEDFTRESPSTFPPGLGPSFSGTKMPVRRPPAPAPARSGPWTEWEKAFATPEAKKATDVQTASMKSHLAENYHGVKAMPDAHQKEAMGLVNKPKTPKTSPVIPAGTEPHVANLIKKGNNFFADQLLQQPKTELPMDQASRLKRAKKLGFRTDLNLYHGTSQDFTQFELESAKHGETAIFTSDKPQISGMYGGKKILPLWGKFLNPMEVNWKQYSGHSSYSNTAMKKLIAEAKANGNDSIIIKDIQDLGGKQNQYVFLKPENLRARDAAAFDPKKVHSPNLLSAAATNKGGLPPVKLPDKSMGQTVTKLSDDLYRQTTKHEKAKLEALEEVRNLPPEAKALGQKFFEFLEPGPNKPKLSPQEKSIFDKHLKPWLQTQRDLYEEIKKLAPDLLPGDYDPNYVHHLVKGKTPEFDEEIGQVSHEPNSPWFGSKTLPRSTRSLKKSKYYVLENDKGGRQVVRLDDKGNLYDAKTNKNIPGNAEDFDLKRASVAEKEAATPLKYYKDAYLSTLSNVVRLQKVANALHFFETMKNDKEFMQFARRPGDSRATPKDYQTTTLPGWEGYKFDPRIVEAMDDWHNKPREAWYENMKDFTHTIVGTMFLLPFRHMANVGGHYYVGRGWGWLPQGWLPFVKHTSLAIWDTLKQGKMTKDMLNEGGALQLPRVLNADFNKQLLKGLGDNFSDNPKDWKWLWDKLNVKEEDIYKGWQKASSTAMWYISDVLMQSLVRERVAKGMNLEQAIRSAEKDIPNYRVNSRVFFKEGKLGENVGRPASRYLQNNIFSMFGRYNNNKWRAIADMVNDIVRGSGKDRAEAVGKALALTTLIYMIYWPLDSEIKRLTGRKDRRSSPIGPADPIDKMKQLGELVMPQTMKRLGATDAQVQATQLLQSAISLSTGIEQATEQGTGHNPFTNQPGTTLGERAQSLADTINPVQTMSDVVGGKASPLEELLKATIGERSVPRPVPGAIQKRDEKAQAKRRGHEPINKALFDLQQKLRPFSPDAMVNRFLPSSSP